MFKIMPEMIWRSQISTENFLHMRYDRTDCALMVSTHTKQANQIADFRAAFETRWMESWYIVHLQMSLLLSLGCSDDFSQWETPIFWHKYFLFTLENDIWIKLIESNAKYFILLKCGLDKNIWCHSVEDRIFFAKTRQKRNNTLL